MHNLRQPIDEPTAPRDKPAPRNRQMTRITCSCLASDAADDDGYDDHAANMHLPCAVFVRRFLLNVAPPS